MKQEDINSFEDYKKFRAEEKKKRQAQNRSIDEIVNNTIDIVDKFCKKHNIIQE